MNPAPLDPLYVESRRLLLDVLEALEAQRESLVLIGAQAIYLRVKGAGLSVTERTTDADLGIMTDLLTMHPQLETMMRESGFSLGDQPGHWTQTRSVSGRDVTMSVDLMVPEPMAGRGRRSAGIGHGTNVARRTRGIEIVKYDRSRMHVQALESSDLRVIEADVAGEAALLVAKAHKIRDRAAERPDRLSDKDALDIHRLLRATPAQRFTDTYDSVRATNDPAAIAVLEEAIAFLRSDFAAPGAPGCRMAARAGVLGTPNPEDLAALTAEMTREVLDGLKQR